MRRITLPGALAALLACATACNLDTSEPPQLTAEARTSADVALAAGNGITEDVTLLQLNEASVAGTTASASAAAPSLDWAAAGACTYDGGSGRFQCPVLTDGGLTLTRSYALFDASGQPQSTYDASTTASANFRAAVSGTVQRPDWTATVTRQRDATVTGLAGAETRRTWNGTAQSTLSGASYGSTAGGVQRSYDLQETGELADVVVALPRRDHPWPLSGTATRHITGTMTRDGAQTVSRTVERTVTVTFNGTSIVPLDVGDRHFWLSLATGGVTPRD
jgi:hypothetical protein